MLLDSQYLHPDLQLLQDGVLARLLGLVLLSLPVRGQRVFPEKGTCKIFFCKITGIKWQYFEGNSLVSFILHPQREASTPK